MIHTPSALLSLLNLPYAQIGDGISRNPPDRDDARDAAENKDHMPKTLEEVFGVATKTRLNGSNLVDLLKLRKPALR